MDIQVENRMNRPIPRVVLGLRGKHTDFVLRPICVPRQHSHRAPFEAGLSLHEVPCSKGFLMISYRVSYS